MWKIIGNERAVAFLQRSLEEGRLGHAYLMSGPPGVGKMTLALSLAQALNCQGAAPPCGDCDSCRRISSGKHADTQIISLEPVGGSEDDRPRAEIGIERIREMESQASLPPFEGKYKVFIIDGAESLSLEAANSMLKTLEEPAERIIFVLLTADERLLPATLTSRCQRLELAPVPAAEIEAALTSQGIEPGKARLLARLCRGSPGWAISAAYDSSPLAARAARLEKLFEVIKGDYETRFSYAGDLANEFSRSRRAAQDVLDLWLDWWRDLLLVKAGVASAITNIDFERELVRQAQAYSLAQIKSVIELIVGTGHRLRQNCNARLALEVLMLYIPRKDERGETLTAQVARNG